MHRQHAAVGQLPIEKVIKSGTCHGTDHLGDDPMCDQQHPLPLRVRGQFEQPLRHSGNYLIQRFTTGWCLCPTPGNIARPQLG